MSGAYYEDLESSKEVIDYGDSLQESFNLSLKDHLDKLDVPILIILEKCT